LIAVIDGSDRRSPKQCSLSQLATAGLAVSGDGTGITDAGAFREALVGPDGIYPLTGFTLTNHSTSILADGVYAEDSLGRLTRHDDATTGGVLVVPQVYRGSTVVDFTGKGGSGVGSIVELDVLQSLFSGGVANGDVVEIFGRTTYSLDPADLPDHTPPFVGFTFFEVNVAPATDFWDLSNAGGDSVFHDSRDWFAKWELVAGEWVMRQHANFTTQQITAAATGAARTEAGELTNIIMGDPTPGIAVDGVLSAPFSLVLIDNGAPFTSGTAYITWELEIKVTRA
jgi:hypothetical protein